MKIVIFVCIFLATSASALSQSPTAKKYFEWYKKNYIIQDPSFANSDSEILFVRQFYIPDGHDAEGRDSYVESLLAKADKEKRFADPVIVVLNLKTNKLTQVDYGWAPQFSKDDHRIVYGFQTIPISGKRVLAETLNGNTIKMYNRVTKKFETIARPDKTFLLDPLFLNSIIVAYKIGDAVNGAFGGGVAFNKINLTTRKIEALYPVTKSHGLFTLVGNLHSNNNNTFFTVYIPQDSATWMANNYSHLLYSSSKIVHDFGKNSFKSLEGKYAVNEEGNLLFLDDDHDLISDKNVLIKYKGNKTLSKRELTFEYHKASLSPNGKFLVYYDYDSHVFLMDTESFKKVKLILPETEIYSVVWSNRSDRLAIVQGHGKLRDTDLISLFDIKGSGNTNK